MNWMQEILFKNLWYLNVILKSRQLGVTTFFCILYLDDVIFNGKDAGLIAHTLDDAKKIFDTKIRYAWDNLPKTIKKEFKVSTENVRELQFQRGDKVSTIYVGTSLRGGTVQRLHVSELGTLDQKYPAKSEEIKSGSFNTVQAGQIITVESTSKGADGVFADLCKVAIQAERMGKKLSNMDWKFFFFPWWKHPDYKLDGRFVIPVILHEYFESLKQKYDINLTGEQKNWYFKKWEQQNIGLQKSMKSEYPSTPEEAFLVSTEGAYFEKGMNKAMEENRITKVPWVPRLPVDTWWDLGIDKSRKDSMSIVFAQDVGLEVHIIDFYGNSGEGLVHYINYLREKPYVYGRHNAPHDIKVEELGTGKTRKETAQNLGLKFDVVENIPFADGINAVRMMLPTCWFDEEKAGELVKALISYRKEWDDNLGKFRDRPLKNWASDPADAFRMMAVGHKDHQRLGFYDKEEEELRKIRESQANIGDNPFTPEGYDPLRPFEI